MDKNTKTKTIDARLISFTAVAAILGAGLAAGMGVSAYGGMMELRGGPIDSEEREAVATALESGDFETWKAAVEDHCTSNVTEERFTEMRERHVKNTERHDAIEEAIEANDFTAWSALSSEFDRGRAFDVITEETFPTFVAMHNAMEVGDYEEADALREELGLTGPRDGLGFKGGMGKGRGMGINR
jgi:hypothetical protein